MEYLCGVPVRKRSQTNDLVVFNIFHVGGRICENVTIPFFRYNYNFQLLTLFIRKYEIHRVNEIFLVYTLLINWMVQKLIMEHIALDDQTRQEILSQVLEGIEFLYAIEVMHRDIKPLNMTVVSMNPDHPEARPIDYEKAQRGLGSHEYKVGTRPYLGPEICAGSENGTYKEKYDERADVYAFGLSMYQFFCQ